MADLDGDGHRDLVTGSYQGSVFWLRGLGRVDGALRFAEETFLADASGEPLRAGKYWDTERRHWTSPTGASHADAHGISAEPIDWDADGDLDLLLGTTDGRIFLRINDGTSTAPRFRTENQKVVYQREGKRPKSLFVKSGYAMPVAADWDGDGLFDVLSGSGDGAVFWWRNTGERGAPRFAEPERLTPDYDEVSGFDAPGVHSQIAIGDYDGDGDMDLLVGDYHRGKERVRHGFVWLYRRR